MKLRYLFIAAALLITFQSYAQTGRDVHGTVTDSTKVTLPGSTVKLLTGTDSLTTVTDAKGAFVFQGAKVKSQFSLVIQSIGYEPIRRRFTLDNTNDPVFLKPVVLKNSTTMLGLVTISEIIPVKIKEDTVEFATAAYKVRDGAPIEDVIKKVPGADVDKDGNITFRGKSVTKVRVNGKEFFGGDLKTATQNLPADAVQSVQMVNDYGDQANLTGIKTGEPETILNINIKPSRNHGYFGQASGGLGKDAIPQVAGTKEGTRFIAQANLFNFNGDQQFAVLGNLNNTNTNLFNFGGPGGGGGGRGGGGRGGPPGGNNTPNGITTARAIGLNYRDSWGKKITVYGSYSFSDNSVYTVTQTLQNNLSPQRPSTNTLGSTQNDERKNHRLTFNLEYKPDTLNYLKISPSYFYGGLNTTQNGYSTLVNNLTTISDYTYTSSSNSSAPNYGINALYNHRFNGHGRNFSINIGTGRSTSDQFQNPIYTYKPFTVRNAPEDQRITTNSHTDTVGTQLSYIEPMGKHSYIEANYAYKHSYTASDKLTDTVTTNGDINRYDILSNNYNFTFITNRFGLNYRFVEKKYNYVLGVTAQPSSLQGYSQTTGQPTSVNSFNVSPNAHFIYNFSRSQSLSINYGGSSSQPTFSELQPVTDFSNASYPITGNPSLRPEYNNAFSLRYNKFDFASGNVFFSNFNFVQTDNKIVPNTVTYPRNFSNKRFAGAIETQFQNTNGYYSASAFYVFAKPWQKRRYNLFFVGNLSYNNNISFLTNIDSVTFNPTQEKNIAKTIVASQGVRFRVDITDVIDAELNTNYTINSSKNSINQSGIQDNFRMWTIGLNGKNYVWKNWTYSYDYSKIFYYGYKGSTNPNIFNTYVERRFLKNNMATLRASLMDAFNQNTGYASTQNGSLISQTNTNRLGRYYLLTFTYRFQKMAGNAPDSGPGRGPGGGRRGGGFGGPPGGGGE
jgi:hypothetical protein